MRLVIEDVGRRYRGGVWGLRGFSLEVGPGTPRAFEAVYAIAWYIGPLKHAPALDFAGASPHPSPHYLPWYLLLTALLLCVAWVARARQLGV